MRIAVLSDIHGNLVALEAVIADIERQAPDEIWCAGDISWGGPWGKECLSLVRGSEWKTIRGNTDVWITGDAQGVTDPAARRELEDMARAHEISADDARWLMTLPLGHTGRGSILMVHGTPQTPFDAPMPDASAADFMPYQGHASLVLYGHVHRAFTRRLVDGTMVCNPGSVGAPSDGSSASYLLIDHLGTELTLRHKRVAYDRSVAIERARALGGPVGETFLRIHGEE